MIGPEPTRNIDIFEIRRRVFSSEEPFCVLCSKPPCHMSPGDMIHIAFSLYYFVISPFLHNAKISHISKSTLCTLCNNLHTVDFMEVKCYILEELLYMCNEIKKNCIILMYYDNSSPLL